MKEVKITEKQFKDRDMSKLIKGAVVPRPIAWVSSANQNGVANLAPFSFFTVASMDPITFCFSISATATEKEKDTLVNIRATGEFVINVVTGPLAKHMHETSKTYDAEVNEFEKAGLKMEKGDYVAVPRVADSPIQMECRLEQVIKVGTSHLVLGRLACYHIADEVYMETDKVDPVKLRPVGRMAGDYTMPETFFSLPNDGVGK